MNIDILSPEFIALAKEAKILYDVREEKKEEFRKIWVKHKVEIEALEKKAQEVKDRYEKVTTTQAKMESEAMEQLTKAAKVSSGTSR